MEKDYIKWGRALWWLAFEFGGGVCIGSGYQTEGWVLDPGVFGSANTICRVGIRGFSSQG